MQPHQETRSVTLSASLEWLKLFFEAIAVIALALWLTGLDLL